MKLVQIFVLIFFLLSWANRCIAEIIELRIPPLAIQKKLIEGRSRELVLPEFEVFNSKGEGVFWLKNATAGAQLKEQLTNIVNSPIKNQRELKFVLADAVPQARNFFPLNSVAQYDLIFVQYWAEWCEPCKEQMQLVDSFIKENSEVNILWLIVERDPAQMDGLPVEFHIHQENSKVH